MKTSDWHGLTMQQNLTWSKALGTNAQTQASSALTQDDPFNLAAGYGPQTLTANTSITFLRLSTDLLQGQRRMAGKGIGRLELSTHLHGWLPVSHCRFLGQAPRKH